jgi:hypothetical protein
MVNQRLDHVGIKVKTKFKKTEGKETIIQFSTVFMQIIAYMYIYGIYLYHANIYI